MNDPLDLFCTIFISIIEPIERKEAFGYLRCSNLNGKYIFIFVSKVYVNSDQVL